MNHTNCTNCSRHKFALNVGIEGNGDANADICLITPYVTTYDDQENAVAHPRHPAYDRLRSMIDYLREGGLRVWVTTMVRCAKNKEGPYGPELVKPDVKETRACLPWLMEERAALPAKVTILLGADVVKT